MGGEGKGGGKRGEGRGETVSILRIVFSTLEAPLSLRLRSRPRCGLTMLPKPPNRGFEKKLRSGGCFYDSGGGVPP